MQESTFCIEKLETRETGSKLSCLMGWYVFHVWYFKHSLLYKSYFSLKTLLTSVCVCGCVSGYSPDTRCMKLPNVNWDKFAMWTALQTPISPGTPIRVLLHQWWCLHYVSLPIWLLYPNMPCRDNKGAIDIGFEQMRSFLTQRHRSWEGLRVQMKQTGQCSIL